MKSFTGIFQHHFNPCPCSPMYWVNPPSNFEESPLLPCSQHLWETWVHLHILSMPLLDHLILLLINQAIDYTSSPSSIEWDDDDNQLCLLLPKKRKLKAKEKAKTKVKVIVKEKEKTTTNKIIKPAKPVIPSNAPDGDADLDRA